MTKEKTAAKTGGKKNGNGAPTYFVKNLQEIREGCADLTQSELSKKSNVGKSTISKIESKPHKRTKLKTIKRLQKGLGEKCGEKLKYEPAK